MADDSAEKMLDLLEKEAAAAAAIAGALLALVVASNNKLQLKAGIGEVPMPKLVKSLTHNETLNYTELTADEFNYFKHSDVMQKHGPRNYCFVGSTNSDTVQVFYGSKEISEMALVKQIAEAATSQRSEISNNAFDILTYGRDISVVSGITRHEAELLREYAEKNGNFPFTIIDDPYSENLSVKCCSEDKQILFNSLKAVCSIPYKQKSFIKEDGTTRLLSVPEYNFDTRNSNYQKLQKLPANTIVVDGNNSGTRILVEKDKYKLWVNGKNIGAVNKNRENLVAVYSVFNKMEKPAAVDVYLLENIAPGQYGEFALKHPREVSFFGETLSVEREINSAYKNYTKNPALSDARVNELKVYDTALGSKHNFDKGEVEL